MEIHSKTAGGAPTAAPRDSRPTPVRHISQQDVACRWCISPRTLERWRWTGQGPRFLKVGGRVVYRIEDIEAYEADQLRTSTLPKAEGGAR